MKVLLATDGTKYSDAATDMAAKLQLQAGDEVKVVCVVDMAVPLAIDIYGGYIPETTEIEKAARENAERIVRGTMDSLKARLGDQNANLSSEVLFGSPDSRIVETAEENGTDLVVIGSHGYNAWERLLLGSVSNSVAQHAPCSVLVVRLKRET